jgi:tryptophan-rich sensory protein
VSDVEVRLIELVGCVTIFARQSSYERVIKPVATDPFKDFGVLWKIVFGGGRF